MQRGFLTFGFLGFFALGVVLVGGAIVALPNWVRFARVDPVVVVDDDLAVVRPFVSEEANGYGPFARATALLTQDEEQADALGRISEPGGWNQDLAESWVAANSAALRELEAATQAAAFQMPPAAAPELDDDLPDLSRWKTLFRLLGVRANLKARAGEQDAAIDDIVALLDLAQRMRVSPSGILGFGIVGVELQDVAVSALLAALPSLEPSPAQSRALERKLARYATNPEDWRRTWADEYQGMKRVILESRVPGFSDMRETLDDAELPAWLRSVIDPDYFYKPNETVALYADVVRDIQKIADEPCSALGSLGAPLDFGVMDAIRPNAIGHVLVEAATSGVRRHELRRCESDTLLGVAQTQTALRAWMLEHGSVPKELDALVPRYLSAVPRDAYHARELQWRAEMRTLWSEGPARAGEKRPTAASERRYALHF